MITKFKLFESFGNKFRYGDYIIYQEPWRNEKYPLTIMSINGTPGPKGTKWTYYVVNELYELLDDELKVLHPTTWEPKEIDKDRLEKNTIYHTRELEDAKETIFIINNSKKYNL